ncbi:helix-turn-helix domain-containing protein [Parapedobacter sp. GCM10030251]|uniref:helix-turn-helix domain-containing protein n=1 Tax=Parapedobacter sp. GCM10030251 TaxID=3273419 RepID=UPI00361616B4
MQEALRLLREAKLPPAAVAYRLGYSEQTSFNHQFKKYYGMSPSEAREAAEEAIPYRRKKFT